MSQTALAIFVAAVLVLLLAQTSAEPDVVKYRCSGSSNNDTSMSFERAQDGVNGRYTAELCTLKNPNWTQWNIDLMYYNDPKHCLSNRTRKVGPQHSTNTLDIHDTTNCTHVCYAMNFDLIFSCCYEIKSTFKNDKTSSAPYDSYHMINNNLTSAYFSHNIAHVNLVNHDDEVSLFWYLGIPPTEFTVELCHAKNATMDQECDYVTRNCTVHNVNEVHCLLSPPYGCYHALLAHEAPWTAGVFYNLTYAHFDFCHAPPEVPKLTSGNAAALWACAGAALAAAALLAAAAARRQLRKRNFHKRVLDSWRRMRSSDVEAAPVVERAGAGQPVLLLYAREGERGQKVVAALKKLVEEATGGMVYDIMSAEVTALAAAAPGAWLRAVLGQAGRVLLLQTPAAAALHRAAPGPRAAGLRLQEPLLGRRAHYRAPHYGDSLLQLALRLIADDADAHHDYHKYYFATLSGLQTDIVPHVVPYRRYELPAAAPALLADLAAPGPAPGPPAPAPAPPAPPALAELSEAAQDLLQHVQQHPDYLMDELIII